MTADCKTCQNHYKQIASSLLYLFTTNCITTFYTRNLLVSFAPTLKLQIHCIDSTCIKCLHNAELLENDIKLRYRRCLVLTASTFSYIKEVEQAQEVGGRSVALCSAICVQLHHVSASGDNDGLETTFFTQFTDQYLFVSVRHKD